MICNESYHCWYFYIIYYITVGNELDLLFSGELAHP